MNGTRHSEVSFRLRISLFLFKFSSIVGILLSSVERVSPIFNGDVRASLLLMSTFSTFQIDDVLYSTVSAAKHSS